ncbi:esterase [Methylorubrum rhodesianum]|jgi:predicted esterase|uniref:Esterase n=1 Tax=Methylorubrum rhodesianum TaxID=29427 RepID=A0ABU9Z819_9HYPH|nr:MULTISPECIES: esterase [Methylorubrum]MBY0139608.1 esterase [Methylorubrum populi]MRI56356.1 esterase [Methylobacterium sp. DB1607]MBB5763406.1 putative esterase [Methylorubrum rhodesianum]MBI1690704.1 esterase [Methylorubrum sp. DB1722]MBK3406458.1 esterase [Methylorubrum rhodesianum]
MASSAFDPTAPLDPRLAGRLAFLPRLPTKPPLPPGRHALGLFETRDAVLCVPEHIDARLPTPLVVLFHGGGGHAEKILPMLEGHAQARGFLLLAPQSLHPTWDLVIVGNGPDRERLDRALAEVADRFLIDPRHLAFAGHSDGGSYALSLGLTNGDRVSHLIVSSAGFMSVQVQVGAPKIFLSHGTRDEQIGIDRSARTHARLLKGAGYDLTYVEYDGPHAYNPDVVAQAVDFFLGDFFA